MLTQTDTIVFGVTAFDWTGNNFLRFHTPLIIRSSEPSVVEEEYSESDSQLDIEGVFDVTFTAEYAYLAAYLWTISHLTKQFQTLKICV